MTEETINPFETRAVCGWCGVTVSCLTSFAVSVPLNSTIKTSDFCTLDHLVKWGEKNLNGGK